MYAYIYAHTYLSQCKGDKLSKHQLCETFPIVYNFSNTQVAGMEWCFMVTNKGKFNVSAVKIFPAGDFLIYFHIVRTPLWLSFEKSNAVFLTELSSAFPFPSDIHTMFITKKQYFEGATGEWKFSYLFTA